LRECEELVGGLHVNLSASEDANRSWRLGLEW
jgi:hypothetical protein